MLVCEIFYVMIFSFSFWINSFVSFKSLNYTLDLRISTTWRWAIHFYLYDKLEQHNVVSLHIIQMLIIIKCVNHCFIKYEHQKEISTIFLQQCSLRDLNNVALVHAFLRKTCTKAFSNPTIFICKRTCTMKNSTTKFSNFSTHIILCT